VVILVDSSAWIEYLRGTGSDAHLRVRDLLQRDETVAITDVIAMEVLAGARSPDAARDLWRMFDHVATLPTRPYFDHEAAAQIYRICRWSGETPRTLSDCMIAAVAIHHRVPLLHDDRDFDLIARHTELLVA
jgi:predicted nucleic acid-binding protein